MKRSIILAVAVSVLSATALLAQPAVMKEESPGLLKRAKIKPDAATATAMAKVPGGKLESSEIEMEDKKLVYVFSIKVAGKTGVEEVSVDAMTGALVSAVHEAPEDEANEAKIEKAKAEKEKADKAKAAALKPKTKPPTKHQLSR